MIDIQTLTRQIKQNCDISDAQHWGSYSLCGLLMRLRELYRTEKGIEPWGKIDQEDIGNWITERENRWKNLEDKDLEQIAVNGNIFGPFDVEKINTELEKEGMMYGAGIGVHMKPSFFLADILSKKKVDGFSIYMAGKEYARDLSDYPAMLQNRLIFSRVEPIMALLWGKFEEMKTRRFKGALAFAFSKYGITSEQERTEDIYRKISGIACSEADTYVHHELGEACEGEKIGDEWKDLLTSLPDGRAEIFARSVKDILSDTSEHGMLKYIMKNRKEGSLGFYIVFLGGLRKIIFPEILGAFQTFVETGDWEPIEHARNAGYKKAEEYAEKLLSLYRNKVNMPATIEYIEKEILGGLL